VKQYHFITFIGPLQPKGSTAPLINLLISAWYTGWSRKNAQSLALHIFCASQHVPRKAHLLDAHGRLNAGDYAALCSRFWTSNGSNTY